MHQVHDAGSGKGIPEGKLKAQGGECSEAGLVPRRVGKGSLADPHRIMQIRKTQHEFFKVPDRGLF